jgi:hypothetical protein
VQHGQHVTVESTGFIVGIETASNHSDMVRAPSAEKHSRALEFIAGAHTL